VTGAGSSDTPTQRGTVKLTCICGREYEISDSTPQWAAPWMVCPACYLNWETER
jgi:hypothetical protein